MVEQRALAGQRIFLVEDESLVAMMMEAMIEELGAVVIGTKARVPDAMDFVSTHYDEIDLAVLDLNLGGDRSYDVAQAIQGHGIPIVFSTGYADGAIDEVWRSHPMLSKPFQLSQLEDALSRALGARTA